MSKKSKQILRLVGVFSFVVEFVFGIISLLVVYFSVFSIHDFLWYNYNLIFVNPILIFSGIYGLVFAFGVKDRSKQFCDMHKILIVFALLALVFKPFYHQKNLYLILFFILYHYAIIKALSINNKSINNKRELKYYFRRFYKALNIYKKSK